MCIQELLFQKLPQERLTVLAFIHINIFVPQWYHAQSDDGPQKALYPYEKLIDHREK